LDRNYQRLIQQQTLCLRALRKKIGGRGRDNTSSFMVSPADYRKSARNFKTFNTLTGVYNNTM